MAKKLIVHFGKYSKHNPGGVESVLRSFLDTEKYCHKFICYGDESKSQDMNETRCAVNFFFLKQPLSFQYLKWLCIYFFSKKAVLIMHLPNLQILFFVKLLNLLSKQSVILFWHADPYSGNSTFYNFLQRVALFFVLNRKFRVIATSEVYRNGSDFLMKMPPNLVEVCRLCIPEPAHLVLKKFNNQSKRKSNKAGRKTILAVGRLVPYKNFEELIRVMPLLPQNLFLRIVGDGPLRHRLTEVVSELKLDHRVELLHSMDREQLIDQYNCADIFCLPSNTRAEAFGIVLIEAIAAGLPIVVNGGLKSGSVEVASTYPYSFMFEAGSQFSLKNAILNSLDCSVDNTVSRKVFRENFSLEQFNQTFLKILEK